MKACILAAGRGTRLAATGHLLPKGLLRIDPCGPSLVEASIERLTEVGIQTVVIVTGHQAESYQALAGPGVRLCHNPRFAEQGSLHSLASAFPDLEGESFLLLESDLLYEPRALELCLAHPSPDLVLLSGPTGAGDEVWVETSKSGVAPPSVPLQGEIGNLVAMSKRRDGLGSVAGELVGISKISPNLMKRLVALDRELPQGDYETDGLVGCARTHPLACLICPDLLWTEIDDEHHLRRAREEVYPRLSRLLAERK